MEDVSLPLVVTTTVDAINGDVSNPAALQGNPGSDGISLREAIEASNHATVPQTILISPSLAGQVVKLTSVLYVRKDGITLNGLAGPDGKPDFTIDSSDVMDGPAVLSVVASNFTIRHFRFQPVSSPPGAAINVEAGDSSRGEPQRVSNVLIERNVFSNPGASGSHGITVGTAPSVKGTELTGSRNAIVADVTIARNTFADFQGDIDAILAGVGGENGLGQNLVVEGNTFLNTNIGIEFGTNGDVGTQSIGTRIVGNSFTKCGLPVTFGAFGNGSVVQDTRIEGNVFSQNGSVDIGFGTGEPNGGAVRATQILGNHTTGVIYVAGGGTGNLIENLLVSGNTFSGQDNLLALIGGGPQAKNNVLSDVTVINNSGGGVHISGGIVEATGNSVAGVRILNNTLVSSTSPALNVYSNPEGGIGNEVTGLSVGNTILVGAPDIDGEVMVSDVAFSRTSQPGFAGVNGNISSDPLFVNPSAGDYHLRPGSPCIDAGTSDGAPSMDIEGFPRFDDPATSNTGAGSLPYYDIGAFEFQPAASTPLNISTRMRVLTGGNVLIGGFIITGTGAKKVIIRALGPSLTNLGVPGALQDPTLELHDSSGATIASNDNWKEPHEVEIQASGIPPTSDAESAIVQSLTPGAYTAILAGKNSGTGISLLEVYDISQTTNSKLANISTRGFVDSGDNVMIGGFIVGGSSGGSAMVLVRAIGPSLHKFGVTNPLQDPTLELHDGNGAIIASNDNWKETQRAQIEATTIPPSDDAESAVLRTVAAGNYTAIVRGADNTTGVALVEVYDLR